MPKQLPAILWLIAMYVGTVLAESGLPLSLIEFERIVTHAVGYAVLGGLMAYVQEPQVWDRPLRSLSILMGVALIAGAGQEALQSSLRAFWALGFSAFDVGVDVVGAAAGVWVGRKLQAHIRRRKGGTQTLPESG